MVTLRGDDFFDLAGGLLVMDGEREEVGEEVDTSTEFGEGGGGGNRGVGRRLVFELEEGLGPSTMSSAVSADSLVEEVMDKKSFKSNSSVSSSSMYVSISSISSTSLVIGGGALLLCPVTAAAAAAETTVSSRLVTGPLTRMMWVLAPVPPPPELLPVVEAADEATPPWRTSSMS